MEKRLIEYQAFLVRLVVFQLLLSSLANHLPNAKVQQTNNINKKRKE